MTTARTFIVAETSVIPTQLDAYLEYIGVPEMSREQMEDGYQDPIRFSDAGSESELLAEFAGRLCYKSFMPGLNPNVTKIREGNKNYIGNILKQKHGSVLEHCTTSVVFTDVSRILTHELVRHRAGMAFSQESQRFVRLDKFDVYIPDLTDALMAAVKYANESDLTDEQWAQNEQVEFAEQLYALSTDIQEQLAGLIFAWGMNHPDMPFHIKKQLTSALRRLVPGGVNTQIMVTGNHRIWRHVIQNRTSAGAEEEIARVFGPLAERFALRYSAFYQDMVRTPPNKDCPWTQYKFANEKI